MLHHYITHYGQVNQDGSIDSIVESWFQVNLFKWRFCIAKRRLNFGAFLARLKPLLKGGQKNG